MRKIKPAAIGHLVRSLLRRALEENPPRWFFPAIPWAASAAVIVVLLSAC